MQSKSQPARPVAADAERPPERPLRLLVTGATGAVGSSLVEEAAARGHQVLATDRPGSVPSISPLPNVQWAWADLTHSDAIPPLVEGIDAVIHTAAWVDIHVPFEIQAPINLDAVRFLYEASTQAKVRTFVFVSTGSLYRASAHPLTEDSPLEATSGYERAKLLAEDFLAAHAGQGPASQILRPALIYGPRGKVLVSPMATVPVLLSFLDGYLPGVLGGPRTNLAHALDVGRAALFLAEWPQPDGSAFNVAADEVATLGDYLAHIFDLAGVRRLGVSVPFPTQLLRAVSPLLNQPDLSLLANGLLARAWEQVRQHHRLVADGVRPRFDVEALPYMTHDTVFDNSRLKALGFSYRFPDFRSGWENTVAWYRAQHWLPESVMAEPDRLGATTSA